MKWNGVLLLRTMNKAELGTSPLTPGFSGWAVRGNETLPSYAFPSLLPPAFASTLMELQCMMLPTLEIVPKGQFQLKNSACYLDHPLIQSWDLVQAAQLCWPRWVHFALHSGTGSSRSAQAVVVLHSSTRSLPAGGMPARQGFGQQAHKLLHLRRRQQIVPAYSFEKVASANKKRSESHNEKVLICKGSGRSTACLFNHSKANVAN